MYSYPLKYLLFISNIYAVIEEVTIYWRCIMGISKFINIISLTQK